MHTLIAGVEAETVARVELLLAALSRPGAQGPAVDAAVFRDAVVVVIRSHTHTESLDDRQIALLREHTTTWSSVGGKDGRTICFELARATQPA